MNVVILKGTLSRDTEVRELPSGAPVVTYEVTTKVGELPAESVPVTWDDGEGKPLFEKGEEIVVVGRVRRRYFRVNGATQSRTEVVASGAVRATDTRRARKLVGEAMDSVSG